MGGRWSFLEPQAVIQMSFPLYNSSDFSHDLSLALNPRKLLLVDDDDDDADMPAAAAVVSTTMNATAFNASYGPLDSVTDNQQLQLELLNYWINGVVTNMVVILGLIGNILTIVILSQRAMRSSTNYYLSALAVWDSIVLVSTVFLIGLPGVSNMNDYMRYVFAYVVSYFYPLALIAQTATIWLTVSFTVERYIAVCHPLKAASMCTISRAKIVILGGSLGSALYNIPRWFDFRPEVSSNPSTNQTVVIPERTEFSQNHVYLQVYFSWLYVPIMCIVPLLVLSILNTFLILAVRKSQRQRKDMNVKQSRENNVTIMLVTVVIVFIICQVPALVYNIAFAIDNAYVQLNFGYQVLSTLRNFLVNFNSAINFLLYCALGQKFRRIFLHTFFRRCINETYIPMSGVHPPITVTNTAMQKGYYKSRPLGNRTSNSTTQSIQNSTTATICTSRSSQESSLMGNQEHMFPGSAGANATHSSTTYTTNYTPATIPATHKPPEHAETSVAPAQAQSQPQPQPSLSKAFSITKENRSKFHRPSDYADGDGEQQQYDMEHLLPERDNVSSSSSAAAATAPTVVNNHSNDVGKRLIRTDSDER